MVQLILTVNRLETWDFRWSDVQTFYPFETFFPIFWGIFRDLLQTCKSMKRSAKKTSFSYWFIQFWCHSWTWTLYPDPDQYSCWLKSINFPSLFIKSFTVFNLLSKREYREPIRIFFLFIQTKPPADFLTMSWDGPRWELMTRGRSRALKQPKQVPGEWPEVKHG